MRAIFKSMVENAILDRDPQTFAKDFYDYGEGDGKVLQLEVFGDEDDETLTERVFKKGTGGHTKEYMDYEGDRYAFHISCSDDVENICKEHDIDSMDLLEWSRKCKEYESFLQNTSDLMDQIENAETREDIVLPDFKNYDEKSINQLLNERFPFEDSE